MDPHAEGTISLMKKISIASDIVASDIEALKPQVFGRSLDRVYVRNVLKKFPKFRNNVYNPHSTREDIDIATTLVKSIQAEIKNIPQGEQL